MEGPPALAPFFYPEKYVMRFCLPNRRLVALTGWPAGQGLTMRQSDTLAPRLGNAALGSTPVNPSLPPTPSKIPPDQVVSSFPSSVSRLYLLIPVILPIRILLIFLPSAPHCPLPPPPRRLPRIPRRRRRRNPLPQLPVHHLSPFSATSIRAWD